MTQDPADDEGVVEEGDDPALAKVVQATQHVHLIRAAGYEPVLRDTTYSKLEAVQG